MTSESTRLSIEEICRRSKETSRILMGASTEQKNEALQEIADCLWEDREDILSANQED